MPRKRMELGGQRFGKLTVNAFHSLDKTGNSMWECVCDCGLKVIVRGSHLKDGSHKSCGNSRCIARQPVPYTDLTGRRFGRLTVLAVADTVQYGKQIVRRWYCACACGNRSKPFTRSLLDGTAQSCGCLARELKAVEKTKHGKSKSKEYSLLHSAKYRANKTGVDFNLELSDIRIPECCPLLGIKIESGTSMLPSSPTVDRIDPTRGYVKGNIWVISQKANRMKSNLTVDQMRHFASTIELISSSLPHGNDNAGERRLQQ